MGNLFFFSDMKMKLKTMSMMWALLKRGTENGTAWNTDQLEITRIIRQYAQPAYTWKITNL